MSGQRLVQKQQQCMGLQDEVHQWTSLSQVETPSEATTTFLADLLEKPQMLLPELVEIILPGAWSCWATKTLVQGFLDTLQMLMLLERTWY